MATISKRGDYQWQAKVRRSGYPSESRTFNTKAEAEMWARMVESEMDRGIFVSRAEAERTTLYDALDRYANEVTVRKKGAARELVRIRRWQACPLANRFLATIRGADLAIFRDEWRNAGKAENTIRLELMLISQVFESARRDWGMEGLSNPVKNIRAPGGSNQRDRRLHGDEERYLLQALENCRIVGAKPIAELALETAMRQSEILNIEWDWIDLKKRTIALPDTKNGQSRRVPLSTRAVDILQSQPRSLRSGRVFQLSQQGISRAFARACTRGKQDYLANCNEQKIKPQAGFLENLRFHDLRHEATTRLFEKGLGLMEVSSITGHKTLSMLKRYTHLRAEDLAQKLG